MTSILLWAWELIAGKNGGLRSRWFWIAIATAGVAFAGSRWHVNSVEAAVQANTTTLKAQFEQAKRDAVQAEAERAQTIINNVKGDYDAQIHDLNQRSARLLADSRAGTMRLRVPVKSCPVVGGDTGGAEANPAGMAATTRAELSDDANQFFIGQAQRADNEAIEHNRLVTLIEAIRSGKTDHKTLTLDEYKAVKP